MSEHDVIGWLVASIIGFAAGYTTCLLLRKAVEVETEAIPDPAKDKRSGAIRTLLGVFLTIMAILTFVQSYAVDQCTGASLARVQVQAYDETQAQIELIQAAQRELSTADRVQIRDGYVTAAEALQQARRDSPFNCSGPFPFPK